MNNKEHNNNDSDTHTSL